MGVGAWDSLNKFFLLHFLPLETYVGQGPNINLIRRLTLLNQALSDLWKLPNLRQDIDGLTTFSFFGLLAETTAHGKESSWRFVLVARLALVRAQRWPEINYLTTVNGLYYYIRVLILYSNHINLNELTFSPDQNIRHLLAYLFDIS